MRGDERAFHMQSPIHEAQRGDLELAWREGGFVDPAEGREARSRICIARQVNLQCLITFDFWATDLQQCDATWTTVLETLQLGDHVVNPIRGPIVS